MSVLCVALSIHWEEVGFLASWGSAFLGVATGIQLMQTHGLFLTYDSKISPKRAFSFYEEVCSLFGGETLHDGCEATESLYFI